MRMRLELMYELLNKDEKRIADRFIALKKEYGEKIRYEFQPVVDVQEGKHEIYGYEALLRTKEQETADFIREMKEAGRSYELEMITFYEGMMQFADRKPGGKLFINSLPHTILSEEEYKFISKFSMISCLDVVVENLEDEVFMDAAVLAKKKAALRKQVFEIALDDYGTGINSVRALKLFKPDIVKIDQSDGDTSRINTLEIMIDEIRGQQAKVLAEGVESWVEYETLRFLGVDYMQGYYLGKPE